MAGPPLTVGHGVVRELYHGPQDGLLRLCLDRLYSPGVPDVVRFWCLQSLRDVLPLLGPTLLFFASFPTSTLLCSLPFLRNKLAQCLAALVRLHFPDAWPDPFLHLLNTGPHAVDMLLRLLSSLADEWLTGPIGDDWRGFFSSLGGDDSWFEYLRSLSPDYFESTTRVIGGIRAQCAPQLARVWFDAAAAATRG